MKHGWKRSLTALVLTAAMALALPLLTASRVDAADLDLDASCTLTVNPGSFEDLANANVVIDLYKVADTVSDPDGYSTYSYSVHQEYGLSKAIATYEDLTQITNEDWQILAQDAAQSVRSGGIEPTATANAGEAVSVSSGLYLVLAHGSDLEKSAYFTTNDEGAPVTIANSNTYVYTFLPELISLPSTVAEITGEVDEDGARQQITTAGGDWQYEVTATLKPTQELRFGDLEVVKTLDTFEDSTDASFVFSVYATLKGQQVYSGMLELDFSAPGTRTATLTGKIPVGAEVTVTEVYSGAGYKLTSDAAKTAAIPAPVDGAKASVSFSNTYNEENKQGYGILNHFHYNDGWTLDNEHDSTYEDPEPEQTQAEVEQ